MFCAISLAVLGRDFRVLALISLVVFKKQKYPFVFAILFATRILRFDE
jgi:hypothetical protein